jgi:methylmalonyl-CoA mutase
MLEQLHLTNKQKSAMMIDELKAAAIKNSNIFENLMEAAKYCSIGQITDALFEVGGQYRRNM